MDTSTGRTTACSPESALGTCASILLDQTRPLEEPLEAVIRRRNLVYSIEDHLSVHGLVLDPLTRALLAASREVIAAEIRRACPSQTEQT